MDRRGWAGEIVDLVHFDMDRNGHIMPDQFEPLVVEQMQDVVARPGELIVHAEDVMAFFKKPLAEK